MALNIHSLTNLWREIAADKSHRRFAVGLGFILCAGFMAQFVFAKPPSSEGKSIPTIEETPDTIIPKGFVLVPIELQNAESLTAIIDQFAIVDLYLPASPPGKKGIRLGYHLRLLKAPLNPRTFAVLVPEDEAPNLVSAGVPLIAVIQNSKQIGLGRLDHRAKAISHVNYYQGGQ